MDLAVLTPPTAMRILVVNAGSSSLKLAVLDDHDQLLAAENLPLQRGRVDAAALRRVVEQHGPFDAVGHRIVHGGTQFVDPVLVDDDVVRRLEALADLAPLHQPKSLRGMREVGRLLPDVPTVCCFDTAFHATIPAAASTYALPAEWRRRWDLRRFGFHGLSHAYLSRRAAELQGGSPDGLRIVTCHLGAGASLAAVHGGASVDTTMGFTPLEGLVMATRSGSIDPGLITWLEEHIGMPPSELAATLEHRSGLLGLTGTADMQLILQAEAEGDPDAALGLGVYLHRLRAGIAAMAAAMGGLDALAFAGGVGEHAPAIRQRAADGLAFLGIRVDPAANATARPECDITSPGATVRTYVIQTREDVEIARGVRRALADSAAQGSPPT
ncbi:MAG TPA: acetate/propionate family kinase [Actinomycetes bacterium]